MRHEFGIARGLGKNTVAGLRLAGERRRILNDLSRFSYSHFLPFTARTHSHKYNGLCTKKRGDEREGRGRKGGRPKRGSANRSRRVECHFLRFLTEEIVDRAPVVVRSPRWRKISNTKRSGSTGKREFVGWRVSDELKVLKVLKSYGANKVS